MATLISSPARISAAGNPPKQILEFVGRVATATDSVSVALMDSPAGWAEPPQRPAFDEYTVVLEGEVHVESEEGQLIVRAGQALHAQPGGQVRYSTPTAGGARYVSVCVPAFSPDTVHRAASTETRPFALGELWLGVEGAALLGSVIGGDRHFVLARMAAIKELVDQMDTDAFAQRAPVPELDVETGYASWAPIYDEVPNALIRAEEPLVEAALDDVSPGHALDAACGTGRHTALLLARGHQVLGVDSSQAMLAQARSKHPGAEFRLGELTSLPIASESMDVVTCGLALTHLADPSPAIAELARVVKPGGRVLISDAHPSFVLIQGQALFPHQGGLAYIRNHVHLHSAYLRSFEAAGLEVIDCAEAPMEADFTRGIMSGAAKAAAALWRDVPVALVWTLARHQDS